MQELKDRVRYWARTEESSGMGNIKAIGKYKLPVACWPDSTRYALLETPNTIIIAVTDAQDLQNWQEQYCIQPTEYWVTTRAIQNGIRLGPDIPKPKKPRKPRRVKQPGLGVRRRSLPDLRLQGPVDFDVALSLREQEYSVPAIAEAYGVPTQWLYYRLNRHKKKVDSTKEPC